MFKTPKMRHENADCVNHRVNRSTTVNAVCYKSKVLSNNESPLTLRVTKDRKRKYSHEY